MATTVVVICALWTLLVVARPLAGWKIALVAGMVLLLAIVLLVPTFATGVFLLHPTPLRVGVAAGVGAAGAVLIELASRLDRSNNA